MLDFYVHESRQRSGCGRKLFEAMMQVSVVSLNDVSQFELRGVVEASHIGSGPAIYHLQYEVRKF